MSDQVEITRLGQEAVFDVRSIRPVDMEKWLSCCDTVGPVDMNRLIRFEDCQVLRVGPRRVLFKSALENEAHLERQLVGKRGATSMVSVINVSDYYLGVRLTGSNALTVLAHAVPVNLYDLSPGSGTATAVFSLGGIVICEYPDDYAVLVERSYLDYVMQRMRVCGLVDSAIAS